MGVRGVEESESTETIHLKYHTMAVNDYMYLKKRHQTAKRLLLNTLQSVRFYHYRVTMMKCYDPCDAHFLSVLLVIAQSKTVESNSPQMY